MTPRPHRALALALAAVSVGLLAAVWVVWGQRQMVEQNQQVIRSLLAQREEDKREQEELRSLVRALQRQVQQLGGTPLLQAPSPSTAPQASPTSEDPAPRQQPRTRATRSPSPRTPTPAPSRPPVSPTPTPTASPSGLCLGPICLPPQEVSR